MSAGSVYAVSASMRDFGGDCGISPMRSQESECFACSPPVDCVCMNKAGIIFATRGLAICGYVAVILAALTYVIARASDRLEPRLYDIVITTNMPNLEENLRYTTTREKRCFGHEDFSSAFPVLKHPALKGCVLRNEVREDADTVVFQLVCTGDSGTAGTAAWHIRESGITGLLSVKMGGKNLTFGQRIEGTSLGACTVAE